MAETIGQQLQQARTERNLTIEQVVQATRIRARHIEAIEADDFESLPSPVQARAFLRIYTDFMGLSLDDLIARQREGVDEAASAPARPEPALVSDQTQIDDEPAARSRAESALRSLAGPGLDKLQLALEKVKEFFAQTVQQIASRLPKPALTAGPESQPAAFAGNSQVGQDGEFSEDADEIALAGERADAPPELLPSQATFSQIGLTLRQRRETLSLTLEEIERHTHVRQHYLLALEAGDFEQLPSSVQTRGMLNNYAHFLDMDVDAVLLKFAEGLQAQRLERQPKPVETPPKRGLKLPAWISLPPGLRRYLSMDVLVGGGLVLLLVIFAAWGTSRIVGAGSNSTPQPTAPSISIILQTPPGLAATSIGPANTQLAGTNLLGLQETIAATNPAPVSGAVQVAVVAQDSAWIRVTVDGKIEFEGRMASGMASSYGGNSQIEVLTGNGAAIHIVYNQSDLGPMGTLGEVVDRIYTTNAILNPTPTTTPTPTITPTPSPTPRPSATPRISPTPTP